MAGYRLAVEQGADVIEPDLTVSRDGALYAHHDLFLSRTTDIAKRACFAGTARDGDWWVHDMDAAQLDQLRLVQRWPHRNHAHDGRYPMPRFDEVLDFVLARNRLRRKPLAVYPEIKHPLWFRERGLEPAVLLAELLETRRATGPDSCVWVQCLDAAVLRQFHARCRNPCHVLIEKNDRQSAAVLMHEVATWARGVAPDKHLLWDAHGRDSGLTTRAHEAGLEVHAWTFRDDADPAPFPTAREQLRMALSLGVDALFCDFPDTATATRDAMEAG